MLAFRIGFLEIHFVDFIDILLVGILLFKLYKLIKGSVALRVFIGFLSLYLSYLVVKATEMELLTEILGQFMGVGVLAAIILFQQEIRKFLLMIGKGTDFNESFLFGLFKSSSHLHKEEVNIVPIIEALKSLSQTQTGALIVFSRNDELKSYVETGDILDAYISKRLLITIFVKNTPLHDGAVIIHQNRIVAARCILPVSDNQDIPANLGLRHRAGIGMTEVTDTGIVIVSEETGSISFARKGNVYHQLSLLEVRKLLMDYLQGKDIELSLNEIKPILNPSVG
jgi:uncharacterized protein (TIGR00159 family)